MECSLHVGSYNHTHSAIAVLTPTLQKKKNCLNAKQCAYNQIAVHSRSSKFRHSDFQITKIQANSHSYIIKEATHCTCNTVKSPASIFAGPNILSRENAPSSEAGSTLLWLRFSRPPETRDRLTEICRVGLYTELFYAIIPTLFLSFLLICYPYNLLHFYVLYSCCYEQYQWIVDSIPDTLISRVHVHTSSLCFHLVFINFGITCCMRSIHCGTDPSAVREALQPMNSVSSRWNVSWFIAYIGHALISVTMHLLRTTGASFHSLLCPEFKHYINQ